MRAIATLSLVAGLLLGGTSTALAGAPSVAERLAAQDELYARACDDRAHDGRCADVNPVRAASWQDYVARARALRPLLAAGSAERADLNLKTGFALRALDLLDAALAMLEEAVRDYGGIAGPLGRQGVESALSFISAVHLKRFDFARVAQTEERIATTERLAPATRTNAARNAVLLYVALDLPTDASRVRATVAGLASSDELLTLDWMIASTDWNAWRKDAPDGGPNHERRVRALASMQRFVRQFENRTGAERPVLEALWRIAELLTPDGMRQNALLPIVQAAKAIDGTRPDDDRRRAWGVQAEWELLDAEIARDFDGKPERSANTTPAQFFGQVAPAPIGSAPRTGYGTLHDLLSETRRYELRLGTLDTSRWPSGGALYHARCGDLRDQVWRAIQLQPPTAFSMSDAIATDAMLDYRWALDWARAKQDPLPARAAIRLRYLEWRLPAVAAALPQGLAPRPADDQAFSALVVTRVFAFTSPTVTAAPVPVP